jgi:hypothetical protein
MQNATDKSNRRKYPDIAGRPKEMAGLAANKPNLAAEGQRERISEEIMGAGCAWAHFCALMGNRIPPSLRYIGTSRVGQH